jgi:hypothetical protein
MRVCDIHAAVENLLSATVPIPTVNCWLSKGVQGDRAGLVRLARTIWLLDDDEDYSGRASGRL